MNSRNIIIAIITGLLAGQVFAAGERPFKVTNSLRFGYNDNVYRNSSNEEESAYVQDILDLAYNASLSERTALNFMSRFTFESDKEENLYPSIFASLNHAVSPRLLLKLSDNFTRDNRTSSNINGRYDYYVNTLSFTPSYIFSFKDSLSAPISYTIKRHEDAIDQDDADILTGGLSWKRELNPQQTWVSFDVQQVYVDYVERNPSTYYNSTRAYSKLTHTFNPKLTGSLTAGFSYDEVERGSQTEDSTNPYLGAGLTFKPSSDTSLRAKLSRKTQEANSFLYANQTSTSLQLGLEHDITARIKGKLTANFTEAEYEAESGFNIVPDKTDEYMDLALRLYYEINRMNSLECGVRYREATYDVSVNDWEQNMVDVGWRVKL